MSARGVRPVSPPSPLRPLVQLLLPHVHRLESTIRHSPIKYGISQQDLALAWVCARVWRRIRRAEIERTSERPSSAWPPALRQLLHPEHSPIGAHPPSEQLRPLQGSPELDAAFEDLEQVLEAQLPNLSEKLRVIQPGPEESWTLYLYEALLKALNPRERLDHGVYFTPQPVARYIVQAVDRALIEQLELPLGLAETLSWGELSQQRGIRMPEGIDPSLPVVQVLEPAMGTGIFLLEVVRLVRERMLERWRVQGRGPGFHQGPSGGQDSDLERRWRSWLPRGLLTRLWGIERSLSPWLLARLERSLHDPEGLAEGQLLLGDALTGLPDLPFAVLIGNPPYAGHSTNPALAIQERIEHYRRLGRGRARQSKWLQNDYVKFLALGERAILKAGCGVLGMITDHSYLDGAAFVGLRASLAESFQHLKILNLNGNRLRRTYGPDGTLDESVFDIQQGTAVLVAVRSAAKTGSTRLSYGQLWGLRADKLSALDRGAIEAARVFLEPGPGEEWWMEQRAAAASGEAGPEGGGPEQQPDVGTSAELQRSGPGLKLDVISFDYDTFDGIDQLFPQPSPPAPGFLTTHDRFAIAFSQKQLEDRIRTLLACSSEAEARKRMKLCSQDQWRYEEARRQLATGTWSRSVVSCLYRPFDRRFTVYDPQVLVHRRERVSRHLLASGNLALLSTRVVKGEPFAHVFVTDRIAEVICLSPKTSNNAFVFPLYLRDGAQWRPNLDQRIWLAYETIVGESLRPEHIFNYVYAMLSAPCFRRTFEAQLVKGFPRVPRPKNARQFWTLEQLGNGLVDAHLDRRPDDAKSSPRLERWLHQLTPDQSLIRRPHFDPSSSQLRLGPDLWLASVSDYAWAYRVGGYPICQKWWKSRRGEPLTAAMLHQFHRVLEGVELSLESVSAIDGVLTEQSHVRQEK